MVAVFSEKSLNFWIFRLAVHQKSTTPCCLLARDISVGVQKVSTSVCTAFFFVSSVISPTIYRFIEALNFDNISNCFQRTSFVLASVAKWVQSVAKTITAVEKFPLLTFRIFNFFSHFCNVQSDLQVSLLKNLHFELNFMEKGEVSFLQFKI